MNQFISACEQAAPRLATLGSWPEWFDARDSLVGRVPTGSTKAPGFDAGVACALELIPRDKQQLAAILHAAYTPAAVEQVRSESEAMDPDSETCWWLAACSICREGEVDEIAFDEQTEQFRQLAGSPEARQAAARRELESMMKKFRRLADGTPFAVQDGGLQGAYLAGEKWGVLYVEAYGIFFIGTFLSSLGLENFQFSDAVDDEGQSLSGPVFGSRQFVKVSSFDELTRALAIVRETLS